MSATWSAIWRRLPAPMIAAAVILAPAALRIDVAPRAAAQTAAAAPLTGQLLVASPAMSDPNFGRTVILIIQHDQNGALGIVINRPAGDRPLTDLLDTPGEKDTTAAGNVRIFAGGPMQPEIGFVVHSTDYHGATTRDLNAGVAMTSSRDILRDIGNAKGPQKSLIAFGYAGWAPGQLEGELARREWVVAPGDAKLVFDEDREKVWDAAFAARVLDL